MTDVPPADHGFALFGTDFGTPPGGFCVSAFLVVRREGDVLVGRMDEARSETWIRSWQPNLHHYEGEKWSRAFAGLRLPATYLREGEHPAEAVRRVWSDQLGYEGTLSLEEPRVISEAGPSNRAPGYNHWDLLFLYEVEVDGPPGTVPDHWAALGFRDPRELTAKDLVMLHGELLACIA